MNSKIPVRVAALHAETAHVVSIRLQGLAGEELPAFEPGAHIDLHLPNGLIRSYSLSGDPGDRSHYRIGVLHDRNSRGGSRLVHQTFAVGHELEISAPRNHFPLDETAVESVFIAGGIGITPMLPMVARMLSLGRKVDLLYACRSRADAAFLRHAQASLASIETHFDDEAGHVLDLHRTMAGKSSDAHFYCCGPAPMLNAFEAAGAALGLKHLHLERFSAAPPVACAHASAFEVELARSGQRYWIAPERSILDVLLDEGFSLPYSCQAGICGSCETAVLGGIPDHADSVLTNAEKAKNDRMLICVSRSRTARLVLDL
ncbi:PDR/VanB family oxidoreductase [Hydrogenophaga sp.]|uniref:PDR/VanB family oxidoreductase n=1 Tax=Hydrogenophaga sp. TaxID=1904254 RepID=UPI002722EAE3|nr:PDR/VanB family oxidoreductase [Hydrogenophaga sp.]MDO9437903.1 PDR/VanB family oxidoreductase [Hydrogenophaga sp.]